MSQRNRQRSCRESRSDRAASMTRRQLLAATPALMYAASHGPRPDSELGNLLQAIVEKRTAPALAGIAITGNRPPLTAVVGVRKHGDPTPARPNDRFHLGSCTKAMTAVLIAQLIEEGKLDWSTRLPDALPDLAARLPAEICGITIDHLLAHRSGLSSKLHPRPTLAERIAGAQSPAAARAQRTAFAADVLTQPLIAPPGNAYEYSNAGYIILGAIIERRRDRPWEEVIRARLFTPLRMRSAGFGAMGAPNSVDQPWQHQIKSGKILAIEPGVFADNPASLGPAGTVHCAPADWARFLSVALRGETAGGCGLRAATWKRLLTPQFGGDYAGGWIVTERSWGGRVLTHAGSNTLSYCVAWLAPDRGFGAAAMTNLGGNGAAEACDDAVSAIIGKLASGAAPR